VCGPLTLTAGVGRERPLRNPRGRSSTAGTVPLGRYGVKVQTCLLRGCTSCGAGNQTTVAWGTAGYASLATSVVHGCSAVQADLVSRFRQPDSVVVVRRSLLTGVSRVAGHLDGAGYKPASVPVGPLPNLLICVPLPDSASAMVACQADCGQPISGVSRAGVTRLTTSAVTSGWRSQPNSRAAP
jgi:hypothetical protein